ncbi:hypothetical protein FA13DRAFT_199851 [Coprinellus micaceus]|uniref:Secreted protein n=1 Tax=Coprinellus micaceus TaxID=71717 RepID=A0A4Y7SGF9_COPMI|nr:hypothetical protein FA13DRAFT_199851 [Coprinellus micaceus]
MSSAGTRSQALSWTARILCLIASPLALQLAQTTPTPQAPLPLGVMVFPLRAPIYASWIRCRVPNSGVFIGWILVGSVLRLAPGFLCPTSSMLVFNAVFRCNSILESGLCFLRSGCQTVIAKVSHIEPASVYRVAEVSWSHLDGERHM